MLGFSTIARIVGIPLGVITLLLLAQHALGVQYKDAFQGMLDHLAEAYQWILSPLENYVVVPFMDWLRSFGWHIPQLEKHWRYAFTLLWLLFRTVTQFFGQGSNWLSWSGWVLLGGVAALVGGIATGTVMLSSTALFAWPLALVFLVITILSWNWGPASWSKWRVLPFALPVPLLFYVGYDLADKPLPLDPSWGVDAPSPGLVYVAMFALVGGLIFITVVLMEIGVKSRRDQRTYFYSRYFGPGVDILGTLGLALAIGYYMAV